MEKLNQLISKCNASVSVEINTHKDFYESVNTYISKDDVSIIEKEVLKQMIEKDSIICIQFHPDTPIGYYTVFHWDLEKAIDQCLSMFDS